MVWGMGCQRSQQQPPFVLQVAPRPGLRADPHTAVSDCGLINILMLSPPPTLGLSDGLNDANISEDSNVASDSQSVFIIIGISLDL